MLSTERRRRILTAVRADGSASVRTLAERLAVSESTIRRDLQLLDSDGVLLRTFGGAVTAVSAGPGPGPREPAHDPGLDERVALRAAELVADGDVVLLDIGSAPALVARALRGRAVTVVTANVAVLDELREDDTVDLVLLGGVLQREHHTLVGPLTVAALHQLTADTVFLSCTGVRASGRVVDTMAVETPVKHAMVEISDRVVLLATEAQFPGTGSFRLCSLSDVDVLVTTAGADPRTTQHCRDAGGEVITA